MPQIHKSHCSCVPKTCLNIHKICNRPHQPSNYYNLDPSGKFIAMKDRSCAEIYVQVIHFLFHFKFCLECYCHIADWLVCFGLVFLLSIFNTKFNQNPFTMNA
jgi:hypothetical protein